MNVLFVHFSYWPTVGGVEWVIHEHARLFESAGHKVRYFKCGSGKELDQQIAQADIVFAHNVMTMPFDLELTLALRQAAARFPEVRFVNWIHDIAACNPDYANVPAVFAEPHEGFESVTVSDLRRVQYQQLTGAKCKTVPNGIDVFQSLGTTPLVEAFARQSQLLEQQLVLLQPARLLKRKNIELTLMVASAIRERNVSARWLITAPPDPHNRAASSQYQASLRRLRSELQLENEVLFVSDFFAVTTSDLNSLYNLADGLFFPSWQEGFGLPVLEAAIHRLPVFCARTEPLPKVAAGRAHLFAPDQNPSEIAELLLQSFAAHPLHLQRKQVFQEFSWDTIYLRHLKAYELLQEPTDH